MSNQPSFHCIANLGDADPLNHGGAFVLIDKRGIYTPELHLYLENEREGKPGEWFTILLEPLTRCPENEGDLGDNRFHPNNAAWFGRETQLDDIAETSGTDIFHLRRLLTSSDPEERAGGYQIVIAYFGPHEFDHNPRRFTYQEDRKRCNHFLRQIAAAKKWKDGIGL